MRILITGATGGLGTAVVEQFLAEGADVLGVARSWKGDDGRFRRLTGDMTSAEDASRIAHEAGEIDALAHLVGGFAMGSSPETWRRMLAINLESAANVIEACLAGFKQRGKGVVVAVGSRAGVEPSPGVAAYSASKAALAHYVRTLAVELKDSGIRVNIVLPSTIDTAVNRSAMPQADASKWVEPASIAKVVAWAVSDAAADVSGALIPVYGRA
jgi:NAD(P)-dependent dehydrogenase (short-subunit alcohol dehydrogenase family)